MPHAAAHMGMFRVERRGRRGNLTGVAITVLLHSAVAGGVIGARHREQEPVEAPRDFVVAQMVKLGKPRDKFWLPRIAEPPRAKAPPATIKLSDDPNAPPTVVEAPRPENADVSKDLRRALERARTLSKAAATEESAEGLPTGIEDGTAARASAGDEYATAIAAAIRKHWTVPAELVAERELVRLEAEVRIKIAEDGTLSDAKLIKPSGNGYYDDSCVQAVGATGKVPPPPAIIAKQAARGFAILFAGKDVGR